MELWFFNCHARLAEVASQLASVLQCNEDELKENLIGMASNSSFENQYCLSMIQNLNARLQESNKLNNILALENKKLSEMLAKQQLALQKVQQQPKNFTSTATFNNNNNSLSTRNILQFNAEAYNNKNDSLATAYTSYGSSEFDSCCYDADEVATDEEYSEDDCGSEGSNDSRESFESDTSSTAGAIEEELEAGSEKTFALPRRNMNSFSSSSILTSVSKQVSAPSKNSVAVFSDKKTAAIARETFGLMSVNMPMRSSSSVSSSIPQEGVEEASGSASMTAAEAHDDYQYPSNNTMEDIDSVESADSATSFYNNNDLFDEFDHVYDDCRKKRVRFNISSPKSSAKNLRAKHNKNNYRFSGSKGPLEEDRLYMVETKNTTTAP